MSTEDEGIINLDTKIVKAMVLHTCDRCGEELDGWMGLSTKDHTWYFCIPCVVKVLKYAGVEIK